MERRLTFDIRIRFYKDDPMVRSLLISFSFFFLLGSDSPEAKIIYTDVIPDTTIGVPFGSYVLDLDNNSNSEYIIWLITSGFGITIISPDSNEILGGLIVPNLNPYALSFNDTIDSTRVDWSDNNGGHMGLSPGGSGQWHGVSDKYLGLRFYIGTDIHYGWARLDMADGGISFTVKDYAYETVPGKGILAGVTVITGKPENRSDDIQFSQLGDKLIIFSGSALIHLLTLHNLHGKMILSMSYPGRSISLDNIVPGIYILQLETDDMVIRQKKFIY